jgi:outer membrane protein assembly factor BamB
MYRVLLWVSILVCFTPAATLAEDWPQFRGMHRDGKSSETGLLKEWPQNGPKLLWTYDKAGVGYAGPVIVGTNLYTSVGRGNTEFVICLDLSKETPTEIWPAKIGPLFKWQGNKWNRGPNVSPTVDGDSVYALGGNGDLVCVDRKSGSERWRKNLPRDFGGEVNPIGGGTEEPTPLGWGYAAAPLVDGENLICSCGGKKGLMIALKKSSGELVWQSMQVAEQASYSSPVVADLGGVRQYIQVLNSGIVGISAKDGKLLWRYKRETPYDDVVVATPILQDDYIFSSVGFGQGCDLIQIALEKGQFTVHKIFSNKNVENRDGGMVIVDGYLYGHSENKGWFCQEFKTGKNLWDDKDSLGRGSIAYADGMLYCQAERGGVVVLIEASPKGWTEKGRLKLPRQSANRLPSGENWTQPVISGGKLYLRDQEFIYCYDLKK